MYSVHLKFQYGATVDIYSLSIIFFELFSGKNPFPGNLFQVYQAKISDIKPDVPSDFPSDLKELVIQSFSKEPNERPPIKDIKSALNKMLKGKETEWNQSITLLAVKSSNKIGEQCAKEELKVASVKNSEEKEKDPTDETKHLCTNLQAGIMIIISKEP
jgi:serine/threonine protein kinase